MKYTRYHRSGVIVQWSWKQISNFGFNSSGTWSLNHSFLYYTLIGISSNAHGNVNVVLLQNCMVQTEVLQIWQMLHTRKRKVTEWDEQFSEWWGWILESQCPQKSVSGLWQMKVSGQRLLMPQMQQWQHILFPRCKGANNPLDFV